MLLHVQPAVSITGSTTHLSGDITRKAWRSLASLRPAIVVGLILMVACIFPVIYNLDSLPMAGRLSLAVFICVLFCWIVLRLPDLPVALAGALALVATGTVDKEMLFGSLGSELIWLLIAAFIMASVLCKTGIAERAAVSALSHCRTVAGVFWTVTFVIFATAFMIPSTSARAAIMLPVFFATSGAIGRPAVTRALALLFPSVILLSACASLTGAGAHMIAADFMKRVGGVEIDFAQWALLGAPFAMFTSVLACGLIQMLFLRAEDRRAGVGSLPAKDLPNSGRQAVATLAVVGTTVVLWATTALHGQNIAIIAMFGALIVASKAVSGIPLKEALKGVEWNLLLFLGATLLIGEALLSTSAAHYLVDLTLVAFRENLSPDPWMVMAVAALVSSLAHIVITSRTARAGVLIPALALPLAAFGADPSALIFVTTIGSGFCQTLTVSAKPVILFGSTETPTFTQADLLRLAAWLLPLFVALLVIFARFVWPEFGLASVAALEAARTL